MFELLVFGTLGFWALFAFWMLTIFLSVEKDNGGCAFFSTVIALVLYHFFGGHLVLPFVANHLKYILLLAGAYLVAGAIWGIIKWWFFVRKQRGLYDEAHEYYNSHDNSRPWADYVKEGQYNFVRFQYRPSPKDNKSKIMLWMMYWPWSFLWTMIDDPIKKAFRAVYEKLAGVYQRISDSAFRDTEIHLETKSKGGRS